MQRLVAALLALMAANCQANAQTNNQTNAQTTNQANNKVVLQPTQAVYPQPNNQTNAQSNQNTAAQANNNVNTNNAIKIDNNLLYELLAIKAINADTNNKGVLSQLISLDYLWNSNSNIKNLFQNMNFCAANAGLYFDQASGSFKIVDLNTGSFMTFADFVARLKAVAAASTTLASNVNVVQSAPVQSGLVDMNTDLNVLDLLKLNKKVSILSGLADFGAGIDINKIANISAGASVLPSGLVDLDNKLDLLGMINLNNKVGVLSGLADAGVSINIPKVANVGFGASVLPSGLVDLDNKLNLLDMVNLNNKVGVLSGLADFGAGVNVNKVANAGIGMNVLPSGLVDAGFGFNAANIANVGAGVGVLSGASDGGKLVDTSMGVKLLNLVDLNTGIQLG